MVMGSYSDLLRCVDAWVEATGISKKKAIFYCQLGKYPVEGEPIIEKMREEGKAVSPLPLSLVPSLPTDGFSMEDLVLILIVVKLSKTPEGLKVLRDVAIQGIKTMGDTMEAIAKASVGNPVSAWANPYLLSIVFERFGIVPHERMAEFRIGLSLVSGVEVAEDVAVALGSIFHIVGGKPAPSEFPTNIDFGDKSHITWEFGGRPIPTAKKKK